jgi:hypothetical protein
VSYAGRNNALRVTEKRRMKGRKVINGNGRKKKGKGEK